METISTSSQAGQGCTDMTDTEKTVEEEEKEEEEEEEENNEEREQKSGTDTMTEVSVPENEQPAAPQAKRSTWVPYVFAKNTKEVHHYIGQDIQIQESLDNYGGTSWPGALALCKYLENHREQLNLKDKAVMEIGAGTGLVSIVASLLGAFVTATDLPEVLSNMRFNLSRNTRGRCRYTPQAAALSWGYDLEDSYPKSVYHYDYLLAADVVYAHNFLGELLATMKHFCQSGTTLLWANRVRFESDLTFTEELQKAFHTTLLVEGEEGMKIYMATCREETRESVIEEVRDEMEMTEEDEEDNEENVEEEEKERGDGEGDKENLHNEKNKATDPTETREKEENKEDKDFKKVAGQSFDEDEAIREGKDKSEEQDSEDEEEGCCPLSQEDTLDHEDEDYNEEIHEPVPHSSDSNYSSDSKEEDFPEEGDAKGLGVEEENTPPWASRRYSKHGKDFYFFVGQEIGIFERLDSYGAVMWPGALALCRYLDTNRHLVNLEDKKVLELGSGTGLVSIVASLLGASVTATDLPEVLPNLTSNIMSRTKQAYRHTPQVKALSWGYDLEHTYPRSVYRYDYVLAADVVYAHNYLSELLATMKHFCQRGTSLIWANKIRFDSDLAFTENFKKAFQTTLLAELGELNIYKATFQDN